MKKLILILMLGVFSAACDDSEELTCEIMASPDFCWAVAAAEAYACNAAATTDGLISEDGKTCEFESGTTATFSPALDRTQDLFDIEPLTITLSDADGQCAKLVDNDDGFTLKTASGTVDVGGSINSYTVDCPDGTTYKSENPLELLSCGDGGLLSNGMPGTTKSGGERFVSFGISPKPADVETGFVDCEFPESP